MIQLTATAIATPEGGGAGAFTAGTRSFVGSTCMRGLTAR
jgi:hypothetical protein